MTLDFSKCKTVEEVEEILLKEQKQLDQTYELLNKFRDLRDEFYKKTLLTEQEKNS
jgi:hypothetical protein